jgi:hypothetical protein
MEAPRTTDRATAHAQAGATVSISTADGTTVVVRTFPEDPHVAADVLKVVSMIATPGSRPPQLLEELERGLRAWYPRMRIRPREELASLSQTEHVWYAMRDGRVHPPDSRLDRLHAAMATARDVTSDADHAIARARELVGSASAKRAVAAPEDED